MRKIKLKIMFLLGFKFCPHCNKWGRGKRCTKCGCHMFINYIDLQLFYKCEYLNYKGF